MKRNLLMWLALGLVAWIAYEKFVKPANASSKVPSSGPGPGPARVSSGVQPITLDPNTFAPPDIHITDPSVITELDMSDSNY